MEACHCSPAWPNTSATSEEARNEAARRLFRGGYVRDVPPPPRLRRFLLPPHPRAVPTPEAPAPPPPQPVAVPGTASPGPSAGPRPHQPPARGVTDQWAPNAQHRLSSSPRWTLTAKQPRPPLSCAGAAPAVSTADLAQPRRAAHSPGDQCYEVD
ncbi:extensin-like [Schistocerca piceifrons]|uniref:extensin-like n=1 Tax=Schistocerca piceifrons TaxID=274613 RepID=UPI001F5FC1E5|nr:extensin-like [Schistocerca piceifrons]